MKLYDVEEGYDVVAAYYKNTKWQHLWAQVERPFVLHWLSSLSKGIGIDIGSGVGPYIPDMVAHQQKVVAIDTSNKMLYQNRQNNALHSAHVFYAATNIENKIGFDDQYFDWALCTRVFSNVSTLDVTIREISRILKNNAKVLISDIHPEHQYQNTAFEIPQPRFNEEGSISSKINIKTHKHDFQILLNLIEKNGFHINTLSTITTGDIEGHIDPDRFEKLYTSKEEKLLYILEITKKVSAF